MSLFITSLNSGSNGNCYYVGNGQEAVLVDAGISCRETVRRLQRLGLSMDAVKAIFVSHEHSDHIRGIPTLAQKYRLPIYATPATWRHCRIFMPELEVRPFTGYEPVAIGGLSVTGFPKRHDAAEPHSFVVSGNGVTVGVFTDIGAPCEHLEAHFSQCQAVFLESNYDEEMLDKGHYPYHLKNRIRGGHGHLSNRQALQFFLQQRSPDLSHLILAHLSKENNRPELVEQLFTPHAGTTKVVVASRFEETPLFRVTAGTAAPLRRPVVRPGSRSKAAPAPDNTVQLSLF
ncbi:MBL fold metallo-hydrolase [Paraflavisolibacter sp. H34]|uniref:MBL fold metallo-hydrolase n=1 Tax=Huijunlia imazamoxiresistens TaxID=3127457 RepID=UPI00301A7A96